MARLTDTNNFFTTTPFAIAGPAEVSFGKSDNTLFFDSVEALSFGAVGSQLPFGAIDGALIPKEVKPIASPVIGTADVATTNVFASLGVISTYVNDAVTGIQDLRGLLQNPEPDEEDSERALYATLEKYLDEYMTGDDINEVFSGREDQLPRFFPADNDEDTRLFKRPEFPTNDQSLANFKSPADEGLEDKVLHKNLVEAGRVVLEDSRTIQRLRHSLIRLRRTRQLDLDRRRRELATLEREIVDGRRKLDTLNNARLEALGDAHASQALASENWIAVENEYATRQKILEDNRGLYYTRVRETPLSRTLPDPLSLRPQIDDQLVPGCTGKEGEDMPDELVPFFDVILELPMNDWIALRGRSHQLPPRRKLDAMTNRRAGRMASRVQTSFETQVNYASVRLAGLQLLTQASFTEFSSKSVYRPSVLSGYQKESAKVLSLEDLLIGPRGSLRRDSEKLRDHLEQAVLCLQDRLQTIPAGIRLMWAEAAENDTLAIESPAAWPGLNIADDENFNDLRSLFELVEWWFARLHPSAGSASVSVMRAMVRAIIMLSAGDDPQNILHGAVTSAPTRLKPGAGIRLALNRDAIPGAILQLINPQSVVVGLVRVDDQDESGTLATVTQVLQDAIPDTRFTVVGKRSGRV